MGTEACISIEIVEVRDDVVFRAYVSLIDGARVADALAKAVADGMGPVEWLMAPDIGIFSRRVGQDTPLMHGDRVEIYHPLQLDPMAARRKRSAPRGK